jgi:hypothetical protein
MLRTYMSHAKGDSNLGLGGKSSDRIGRRGRMKGGSGPMGCASARVNLCCTLGWLAQPGNLKSPSSFRIKRFSVTSHDELWSAYDKLIKVPGFEYILVCLLRSFLAKFFASIKCLRATATAHFFFFEIESSDFGMVKRGRA